MVERCLTGTLEYVRKDGGTNEVAPEKTTVHLVDNHRLYVHGNLDITTDERSIKAIRATLCGCGYSNNKPFCDNSEECKP